MSAAKRRRPQFSVVALLLLTTTVSLWFAIFRFTGYSPLYLALVVHTTAPVNAVFVAILLRRKHPRIRAAVMVVVLAASAAPLFLVLPIAARFVPEYRIALATIAAMVIWAILLFSISTVGDWLFRDADGHVWPRLEEDRGRRQTRRSEVAGPSRRP
jgi:hypothetical protein